MFLKDVAPAQQAGVLLRGTLCLAVCCSVLQCVAVCCSVLQCVAVCCSVLQCFKHGGACAAGKCVVAGYAVAGYVVCCSVLQCVAVCCSVLQCAAVCCGC